MRQGPSHYLLDRMAAGEIPTPQRLQGAVDRRRVGYQSLKLPRRAPAPGLLNTVGKALRIGMTATGLVIGAAGLVYVASPRAEKATESCSPAQFTIEPRIERKSVRIQYSKDFRLVAGDMIALHIDAPRATSASVQVAIAHGKTITPIFPREANAPAVIFMPAWDMPFAYLETSASANTRLLVMISDDPHRPSNLTATELWRSKASGCRVTADNRWQEFYELQVSP